MAWQRGRFAVVVGVFQVAFLVLFALFTTYDDSANASSSDNHKDTAHGGADPDNNTLKHYYPMFQDVHVMIFIGFGFLMTFLKRYGYGAVGFNFLVAAFVLQWATLMLGFRDLHHGKIVINITSMLTADFAAAAVLISFGAVLGKASPLQLIIMSFIEIICFAANEHIGVAILGAVDMGGSMFVHTFGAYFGLAVARVLYRKEASESYKNGSNYHSDLFSMIGTVFLWIYWPSFNAALAPGDDQQRAVINTYLALASCCVTTFVVSSLLDNKNKFDMVHIQNATLAGGVAVGTSADMMINPYGAIFIGMVAAILSTVGFKFISPFLEDKLKVHDTCGVHNLHGMPGVLAGVIGAITAAMASTEAYGNSLYEIFPARAPANGTELLEIQSSLSGVVAGLGRDGVSQGGYQAAALGITLIIALITGAVTGLLLKLDLWHMPRGKDVFDDGPFFGTPDDFDAEAEQPIYRKPSEQQALNGDTNI